MAKSAVVGVVGATGAVGAEVVKVLHDRKFPLAEVKLFASERSADRPDGDALRRPTRCAASRPRPRANATSSSSASPAISPGACEGRWRAPALVIDSSSAFRLAPDVPLVIPEINPQALAGARLVAIPTAPWRWRRWRSGRCTAPSALREGDHRQLSGGERRRRQGDQRAGWKCARAYLDGKPVPHSVFAHPLAFNVIPHIDRFSTTATPTREMKVMLEMRKVFNEPELAVSCTAVRVPTIRAHAEAITIETDRPISPSRRAPSWRRRRACASSTTSPTTPIPCRSRRASATTSTSAGSAPA